jgi:hypothetical protein
VVLELEVEDEEHGARQADARSGGEGEDHEGDAAHGATDLRHEVEHRHPGPEQRGQGHAEQQAHRGHDDAGDGGHEDGPGEVLAHHPVAEPAEVVGPAPVGGGHEGPQPGEQVLAVEQQGHGGEEGGRGGQCAAQDRAPGVLHRRGVAGQPLGELVEEALDPVRDLGVAQLRADHRQVAEVVDHLGQVLAEVPGLVGGGGSEEGDEGGDRGQQRDEHHRHGEGAPAPDAALEAGDQGVEGEGEEGAEHEPGEGPGGAPDEAGEGEQGDERAEHPDDRAPVEVDDEVLGDIGGGGGAHVPGGLRHGR